MNTTGVGNHGRRSLYALCSALILGALLTCVLAGTAKGADEPNANCTSGTGAPYRIDAGGYLEVQGSPSWCKDTEANPSSYVNAVENGNQTYAPTVMDRINTSHPSVPADTPPRLFKSERWDPAEGIEMSWAFPVEPGDYEVRLYFAEIYEKTQTVGARKFDVLIEGQTKLDNYDIFKEAGGGYKGIVEKFTVASDDTLEIDFNREVQNPSIAAIEILPITEPPPPVDAKDPVIGGVRPKPGSKISDRTPMIRAVVRDQDSELTKASVKLFVDGKPKAFSYDEGTDRLSRASGRLSYGWHRVKVVATDPSGNRAVERWAFKVVKVQA